MVDRRREAENVVMHTHQVDKLAYKNKYKYKYRVAQKNVPCVLVLIFWMGMFKVFRWNGLEILIPKHMEQERKF